MADDLTLRFELVDKSPPEQLTQPGFPKLTWPEDKPQPVEPEDVPKFYRRYPHLLPKDSPLRVSHVEPPPIEPKPDPTADQPEAQPTLDDLANQWQKWNRDRMDKDGPLDAEVLPTPREEMEEAFKDFFANQGQSLLSNLAAGLGTKLTGSATLGTLIGQGTGMGAQALAAISTSAVVGIGLAGTAAVALAETFNTLRGIADEFRASLGELVGVVAVAEAEAKVATIQKRLQIGSQIGPELAEYIRAETQLSLDVEQIKATLLKDFLPIMRDILKVLSLWAKVVDNVAWPLIQQEIKMILMSMGINPELIALIMKGIGKAIDWFDGQSGDAPDFTQDPEIMDFLDPGKVGANLAFPFPDAFPPNRQRRRAGGF